MGSRQFIILLLTVFLCFSCVAQDKTVKIISGILTKTGVDFTLKATGDVTVYSIEMIEHEKKRNYVFEKGVYTVNKHNDYFNISINMIGANLLNNSEYELIIKIKEGLIVGKIFLGNPIRSKIDIVKFPFDNIDLIKVIILSQYTVFQP